jgi:hypothetical protein
MEIIKWKFYIHLVFIYLFIYLFIKLCQHKRAHKHDIITAEHVRH